MLRVNQWADPSSSLTVLKMERISGNLKPTSDWKHPREVEGLRKYIYTG